MILFFFLFKQVASLTCRNASAKEGGAAYKQNQKSINLFKPMLSLHEQHPPQPHQHVQTTEIHSVVEQQRGGGGGGRAVTSTPIKENFVATGRREGGKCFELILAGKWVLVLEGLRSIFSVQMNIVRILENSLGAGNQNNQMQMMSTTSQASSLSSSQSSMFKPKRVQQKPPTPKLSKMNSLSSQSINSSYAAQNSISSNHKLTDSSNYLFNTSTSSSSSSNVVVAASASCSGFAKTTTASSSSSSSSNHPQQMQRYEIIAQNNFNKEIKNLLEMADVTVERNGGKTKNLCKVYDSQSANNTNNNNSLNESHVRPPSEGAVYRKSSVDSVIHAPSSSSPANRFSASYAPKTGANNNHQRAELVRIAPTDYKSIINFNYMKSSKKQSNVITKVKLWDQLLESGHLNADKWKKEFD